MFLKRFQELFLPWRFVEWILQVFRIQGLVFGILYDGTVGEILWKCLNARQCAAKPKHKLDNPAMYLKDVRNAVETETAVMRNSERPGCSIVSKLLNRR